MAFMELAAKIGLDSSSFSAGINKAKSSVASLRSSIGSSVGSQVGGMLGVAAIVAYAKSTVDLGGKISDTSTRLGISAEELQRWTFAATQTGASAENITSFFEKLAIAKSKALAGDKAAIASFKALGVSMDDLKNKRIADLAIQVGQTVQGGDVQALSPSLMAVGGKGAGALIPAFKSDFENVMASAPVMSNESVAKLDEAGDAMDKMMLQLRGPMAEALTTLVPIIQSAVDGFNGIVAVLKDLAGPTVTAWMNTFSKLSSGKLPSFKDLMNLIPFTASIGFATGDNKMTNLEKYGKDIRDRETEAADAEFFAKKAADKKAKDKAKAMKELDVAEKVKPTVLAPLLAVAPTIRDSLANIGGFTMAQNREVLDVQKDQLSTLEKIAENTDKLKDVPKPVDDGL